MASTDDFVASEVPEDSTPEETPAEGSQPADDEAGGEDTSTAPKEDSPADGASNESLEMTEEDINGIIKIQATYRGHLARKQVAATAADNAASQDAADPAAADAADADTAAADAADVEGAAGHVAPEEAAEEPAAADAAGGEAADQAAEAEAPAAGESAAAEDDKAAAKAATTIQASFRGHQARKELAASKQPAAEPEAAAEEADAPSEAAAGAAGAACEAAAGAADAPSEAAAEAADAPSKAAAAGGDSTAEAAADTQAEAAAAAAARKAAEAAAEAAEPIIVVCGPSGVGKGTLIGRLMQDYPQRFGFSVSHTTRGPRPGEEDGVHYHFRSKDEVLEGVRAGLFLEHAEVHGNVYGTSIAAAQAVAKQGKLCVLDIDTQGAEQVKKSPYGPKALFLFVAPPSMEELERRLRGRGTETQDKIATRLKNAHAEMAKSKEPGFFSAVITNNDLDAAYTAFKSAIRAHIPNSIPSDPPAAAAPPPAATKSTKALDALLASPSRTWATDDMRGLPVRQYMNETVVPVLREALRALNKGRPEDPLQFVADFVLAERTKLIQSGQY